MGRARTSVRRARSEDLAAVTGLERTALGADAWSETLLHQALDGALPTVHVVVAERGGVVVGHAVVSLAGDVGELQRLATAPAQRRTGVATALLTQVVELVRSSPHGGRRVLLEVREENAGALVFYARQGFTELARRPRYYADGATAVVMELELPNVVSRVTASEA